MENKKLSLEALGRKSVEEAKNAPKTPLILILDNIRSLNNVGAIFRTADAFLIEKYTSAVSPPPRHIAIFIKPPLGLPNPLPGHMPMMRLPLSKV